MQTNFDGIIFMHRVVFVGHTSEGKTETVQSVTIPMHLTKLELNLDAQKGTYTAEFMPNMNFDVTQHNRWLTIHDAHTYFTGKGVNNLGAIIDSFELQLNTVSSAFYDKAQKEFRDAKRITVDETYGRKVQYQITIPDDWRVYRLSAAATADATEILHKAVTSADQKKLDAAKKEAADAKKAREDAAKEAAADAAETAKEEAAAGNPPTQIPQPAKAAEPKDAHITVETDRQITEVLDMIFKQVPQLAELGAGRKTAGEKGSVTFYKHFVGITSSDSLILVHVDVVPFEVPNVLVDDGGAKTISAGDAKFYQDIDDNGRRVPKNFMEFDYIFTGTNKDVLNFDMKLQDLQFMLASQLNLGPGVGGVIENVQSNTQMVQNGKAINQRSELITTRKYDAILMPKKSADELNNFKQYSDLLAKDARLSAVKDAGNYMRNLSMYYAMSPIIAILTIRGNPDIMTKFNQNSFLPHPPVAAPATNSGGGPIAQPQSTGATQGKHDNYRKLFEQRILNGNVQEEDDAVGNKTDRPKTVAVREFEQNGSTFRVAKTLGNANYAMSPVFARVNIKGPKVDFRTGKEIMGGDFAERLLTDNFYVVFRVTNIIERNAFTQQLELYSHNIFGTGKVKVG